MTSKDVAFELDAYCDWKLNKAFTVSFLAAYANPQKFVEQAYRPDEELRVRDDLRRVLLLSHILELRPATGRPKGSPDGLETVTYPAVTSPGPIPRVILHLRGHP